MTVSVKVILLSSDYLPNVGGIAAHVGGLSQGLSRLGHRVRVVVPSAAWPLSKRLVEDERVNSIRVTRLYIPRVPWAVRSYFVPLSVSLLNRIVREDRAQVLHWHVPFPDTRIATRVPCAAHLFTNHTSQFLEWELQGKNHALAREVVNAADGVIAPSSELARAAIHAGIDARRCWTIPNGVDTERFSPDIEGAQIRRRLGIQDDEVVVTCPRRLEKKNGVPYWLASIPLVLKGLPVGVKARFLLVGDYPREDAFSDRARVLKMMEDLNLGHTLMWAGQVPPSEMSAYMAASDIVVIPSLMEATSIAALEAMASSRAVIGTEVGGLPEIIRHKETGWIVAPASAELLADATIRLLVDAKLCQKLGAQARNAVEREFTWDSVARRTEEIYLALLGLKWEVGA